MRRFFGYYRQFDALAPEEVSAELKAVSDERRRRALERIPALDLSSPAWHQPPHAEAVNAATYALRRSLNAYPDPTAAGVRAALAERHGVPAERIVVGHGAGELLRAACHALLSAGDELVLPWPGWGPLPELAARAGGRPVPVALTADGAPDLERLAGAVGPATRVVAVCSPNDPTGAGVEGVGLRALADALPERVTLVIDEALADFRAPAASATALAAGSSRVLVVRSLGKAHALAGLRAGYALAGEAFEDPAMLGPYGGVGAPVQAAMAWAVEHGETVAGARRAAAARDRARLADALAGSPATMAPSETHIVWLAADGRTGPELAAGLAAERVLVTPGTRWGDERHVRAALRGPEAVDRLAAALLAVSSPA